MLSLSTMLFVRHYSVRVSKVASIGDNCQYALSIGVLILIMRREGGGGGGALPTLWADHEVGPFCPDTIEATAADAGIWFDGNGLYDLDGDFIVGLADLYDDDNWMLYDAEGNVNVTDTVEAFEGAARPNVDPEYQNHCVEGRIEWLDNGEPVTTTVLIPTTPVAAGGFKAPSLHRFQRCLVQ